MKKNALKWPLLLLLNLGLAEAASALILVAPAGTHWGASATDVQTVLLTKLKPVEGSRPPDDPDRFLFEQRYQGDWLGLLSDHVAPMFYGGRFFSLAASYSPATGSSATLIWETLVEKLSALYGKPQAKTKPLQILSIQAILRLLPDEANRNALMELYNAADRDRKQGNYVILDLEIQTGIWVPEATWSFDNGASVKAVMRAGGQDQFGLKALKPAVIYTKYDLLK